MSIEHQCPFTIWAHTHIQWLVNALEIIATTCACKSSAFQPYPTMYQLISLLSSRHCIHTFQMHCMQQHEHRTRTGTSTQANYGHKVLATLSIGEMHISIWCGACDHVCDFYLQHFPLYVLVLLVLVLVLAVVVGKFTSNTAVRVSPSTLYANNVVIQHRRRRWRWRVSKIGASDYIRFVSMCGIETFRDDNML